jgi:hypothetical protein
MSDDRERVRGGGLWQEPVWRGARPGRPGLIRIRIPDPGIFGIQDIFHGAVICLRFWEAEREGREE